MIKFLVPVLLASTVAVTAPAAAQWAPPVPQGYAYGYNNHGQLRRLEVRVAQLRQQIRQLDRRNILSNREARRLEIEARHLQQHIRQAGYNGLNSRERYEIQRAIAHLERNIHRQATDGNRRYANNYGYNGSYGYDRDRDGRDDRYEDDRGRDHDGRRDRHDDDDD